MRGLVVVIVMLALLIGLWVGWGLGSQPPAPRAPVVLSAPPPSPVPTQDLKGLVYAASSNAADVAEGRAMLAIQTTEAGWRATEVVTWATREADLVNRAGRAAAAEIFAAQPTQTPQPTPTVDARTPWPACAPGAVCTVGQPKPTTTPKPPPACHEIALTPTTTRKSCVHVPEPAAMGVVDVAGTATPTPDPASTQYGGN